MSPIKLQTAQHNVVEKYLASPNVVGAGVGVKYINSRPTDEPAIVIFVEKKYPKDYVRKQSDLDLIPQKVDGITTDIIEVGKIEPQQLSLRNKVRPICPGLSVGHQNITAGTLGAIFVDADGDLVALSNNHVLANENRANVGDVIFQPGPLDSPGPDTFKGWDGKATDWSYFGTLKRFSTINKDNNSHDSAIAKIHESLINDNLVSPAFPSLNRTIAGFGDPAMQMPVQKIGRTTGYTTGQVIALRATFTIGYDFGPATFTDCVVCTAMSAGGDSGSVIMDMEMNAVALLFAGSDKVTLASPMKTVRDYYGLQLWNGKPTPPTTLFDKDWKAVVNSGNIELLNGKLIIKAKANEACYWEKGLTGKFDIARASVVIDSDKGATWGPGLALLWSGGVMKMNVRSDNQICGTFNTNQFFAPAPSDKKLPLRIRRNGSYLSGEYMRDGSWVSIMNIDANSLPGEPVSLRIGKTDPIGGSSNHSELGESGTCLIEDLLFS